MLRATAVLISIIAPLWAAHAQDNGALPLYNVDAFCDKLAHAQGDDDFARTDCLEQEKEHLDKLLSAWPTVPVDMKAMCDDMLKSEGPSYSGLYYCIVAEYESEQGYSPF